VPVRFSAGNLLVYQAEDYVDYLTNKSILASPSIALLLAR
jgi:hypothetical protein